MYKKAVMALLISSISGFVNGETSEKRMANILAEMSKDAEKNRIAKRQTDLSKIYVKQLTLIYKERRSGLCEYQKDFGTHDGWCWSLDAVVENATSRKVVGVEFDCEVYFDGIKVVDAKLQKEKFYGDGILFPPGSNVKIRLETGYGALNPKNFSKNFYFEFDTDYMYKSATYSCQTTDFSEVFY